jgi:hypothetical protein
MGLSFTAHFGAELGGEVLGGVGLTNLIYNGKFSIDPHEVRGVAMGVAGEMVTQAVIGGPLGTAFRNLIGHTYIDLDNLVSLFVHGGGAAHTFSPGTSTFNWNPNGYPSGNQANFDPPPSVSAPPVMSHVPLVSPLAPVSAPPVMSHVPLVSPLAPVSAPPVISHSVIASPLGAGLQNLIGPAIDLGNISSPFVPGSDTNDGSDYGLGPGLSAFSWNPNSDLDGSQVAYGWPSVNWNPADGPGGSQVAYGWPSVDANTGPIAPVSAPPVISHDLPASMLPTPPGSPPVINHGNVTVNGEISLPPPLPAPLGMAPTSLPTPPESPPPSLPVPPGSPPPSLPAPPGLAPTPLPTPPGSPPVINHGDVAVNSNINALVPDESIPDIQRILTGGTLSPTTQGPALPGPTDTPRTDLPAPTLKPTVPSLQQPGIPQNPPKIQTQSDADDRIILTLNPVPVQDNDRVDGSGPQPVGQEITPQVSHDAALVAVPNANVASHPALPDLAHIDPIYADNGAEYLNTSDPGHARTILINMLVSAPRTTLPALLPPLGQLASAYPGETGRADRAVVTAIQLVVNRKTDTKGIRREIRKIINPVRRDLTRDARYDWITALIMMPTQYPEFADGLDAVAHDVAICP